MDRLFPFYLQGEPDNNREFAFALMLAIAVNCIVLALYVLTVCLCIKLVF